MNDAHDIILDRYFWDYVDRGDAPEATPLFTGIQDCDSLVDNVCHEFGMLRHEAENAIEIARQEVEL